MNQLTGCSSLPSTQQHSAVLMYILCLQSSRILVHLEATPPEGPKYLFHKAEHCVSQYVSNSQHGHTCEFLSLEMRTMKDKKASGLLKNMKNTQNLEVNPQIIEVVPVACSFKNQPSVIVASQPQHCCQPSNHGFSQ